MKLLFFKKFGENGCSEPDHFKRFNSELRLEIVQENCYDAIPAICNLII